ncbi:MAG: leucine-rich repeat domain-containing protein, partial [Prochloraceae cyanobacterium]
MTQSQQKFFSRVYCAFISLTFLTSASVGLLPTADIDTAIASSAREGRVQPSNSAKSFQDWCLEKDNLSSQTQYTIEVLLEFSGEESCDLANRVLTKLKVLSLNFRNISDLRPLGSLTRLTQL